MRTINKILLVSPPGVIHIESDGTKQTKECPPLLGLAYLSAQLSNEYQVKIYDMVVENFWQEELISKDTIIYGDNMKQFQKVLSEYNPDLVGVSSMLSSRANCALNICKLVKKFNNRIITVVGGYHAAAIPAQFLKKGNTDFLCLGESDYRFPKLLKLLKNGNDFRGLEGLAFMEKDKVIINPIIDYLKNIDDLPFPDWDTAGIKKYWKGYDAMTCGLKNNRYVFLNTSRGCPHICHYCAVPNHTGKKNYRARSLDKVIQEISWLKNKYKIAEVAFTDDNFFVNKTRLKKLCRILKSDFADMTFSVPTGTDLMGVDHELIDLLAEANFHDLAVGIETGNVDYQGTYIDKKFDLKEMKQKIKHMIEAGLNPSGFFLLGFPNETKEQIKKTTDLATSLNLNKIYLIMLNPLPGSQLYEDCIKNNLLYDDFDVTKIRYSNTFIKNKNISRKELEGIRKKVWRDYMINRGVDVDEYDNKGWSEFQSDTKDNNK